MARCFNHKVLLNFCNFIFLICGTLLICSGFYILYDSKRLLLSRLLSATSDKLNDLPQPLFYYVGVGVAIAGLVSILASMMGFWATCLNTFCCLSFYFLTVIVLLLAQSAICLAIVLWPHCLGISLDGQQMVTALEQNYGVPGREQFTIAMDFAQSNFGCCGMNAEYNYNRSIWKLEKYGSLRVPLTCCILENSADSKSYLDPRPANETLCQADNKQEYVYYRFTQPCLQYLDDWYREQYSIFLIVGLVIAIVEFLVLISITMSCTHVTADQQKKEEKFLEMRYKAVNKPRKRLMENIYEPEVELRIEDICRRANNGAGAIQGVPSDISEDFKEVYIQPRNLYKNRFNTTFKPISSDFSGSNTRNYLV